MSVGSHLLNEDNLRLVGKLSWKFGRPKIIEAGMRYYDDHPEDVERVAANLEHFGLPGRGEALDRVLGEIVAHYYEKLFVLVKGYEAYWIAGNRVEVGDSLEPFYEAREAGRAVFVGQSHFGATYLMASVLMVNGIDVNTVGNFPEPVGGMLQKNVDAMAARWKTGRARLLNLADPSVDVPAEMLTALGQRKVVSNVYDENNRFCREVELLGRRIRGGTGMDKVLAGFDDSTCTVVTPFLVRTSDETFRYELDRHSLDAGDIIESFFSSYEKRIRAHFEQWYFINEVHESFVD
ncbi:MAG: hypothetical protein R6V85_21420 [Polyangia bacterium]